MTIQNDKNVETQKVTVYDDLKKALAGDVSNVPCHNSITGCSHHN